MVQSKFGRRCCRYPGIFNNHWEHLKADRFITREALRLVVRTSIDEQGRQTQKYRKLYSDVALLGAPQLRGFLEGHGVSFDLVQKSCRHRAYQEPSEQRRLLTAKAIKLSYYFARVPLSSLHKRVSLPLASTINPPTYSIWFYKPPPEMRSFINQKLFLSY